MNKFRVQGAVVQSSDGDFVRLSDVEDMRDSLLEFISNFFDPETGKGLSKDETLEALGTFFRLTLAE